MTTATPPTIPGTVSYAAAGISNLSLERVVNQQKSGTLTLAQMLALYSTPVTILPALPTGYMYVVDKFVLEAVYGSLAFSGGGVIYLQYGSTAHGANKATDDIAAAFLTTFPSSKVVSVDGLTLSSTGIVISAVTGAVVSLTAADAVFTGGTGATGAYTVYYHVVPLPVA